MNAQPFWLLELGSNSLKCYLVEVGHGKGYRIDTRKIPWRVAHDFFAYGALREDTVEELLEALSTAASVSGHTAVSKLPCLATGVFRELPDLLALAQRVMERTGLRIRVISGDDEAKLMGKSLPKMGSGRILVADLGGATTEWVWLMDGKPKRWGSMPLGAIRTHCKVGHQAVTSSEYLARAREMCAAEALKLSECGTCELLVTGGTAKALARSRGHDVTSLEELRETIRAVHREGAPQSLKPARREVYLPGLVVLEQLAVALNASKLEYARASVKEGMARRLVALLARRGSGDLHATLLLHTTSSSAVIP